MEMFDSQSERKRIGQIEHQKQDFMKHSGN